MGKGEGNGSRLKAERKAAIDLEEGLLRHPSQILSLVHEIPQEGVEELKSLYRKGGDSRKTSHILALGGPLEQKTRTWGKQALLKEESFWQGCLSGGGTAPLQKFFLCPPSQENCPGF